MLLFLSLPISFYSRLLLFALFNKPFTRGILGMLPLLFLGYILREHKNMKERAVLDGFVARGMSILLA